MVEQIPLIHEDWRSALRYAVDAIGGPAQVGVRLWPAKSGRDARVLLLHCLSPDRPEKLDLEEIEWILAEARKAGAHAGLAYLCRSTGYADPQPITPEDEQSELMRQFVAAQKAMSAIVRRLDGLQPKVRAVE